MSLQLSTNNLNGVSSFLPLATFEDTYKFAVWVSKSGFAPKPYQGRPEDIMIAWEYGAELGLKRLQTLQNLAVIKGRPCVWGDMMKAICMATGKLEKCEETWDNEDKTKATSATCRVIRSGMAEHVQTFTIEDARKLKLLDKRDQQGNPLTDDPWKTIPWRMMQMRARAFALRDTFPDYLKGIISYEEAIDLPPSAWKEVKRTEHKRIENTKLSKKVDVILSQEEIQQLLGFCEEQNALDRLHSYMQAKGLSIYTELKSSDKDKIVKALSVETQGEKNEVIQ